MADWSNLTIKERALVAEYLQTFSQVKAFKKVYPGVSKEHAASWAYEPFNRPHVKEVIAELLAERVMEPSEVLQRLQEIAKGTIGDYLNNDGTIDIERLVADGKGYLLKNYKKGRTNLQFEFVDYQRALETLAKIQGLYDNNKVTINLNSETLEDKLTSLREKLNESKSE